MGFIRENILKFVIIFGVVIIMTIIFSMLFTKTSIGNVKGYAQMEDKLKSLAQSYVKHNQSILPKTEGTLKKISMETLIDSKKMKQYHSLEDENVLCTGYVTVTKKGEIYIYKPYIKCGNYETKSISDYIIKNEELAVDKDGLYKINNKYVYRGENPNNYIMLGEKLYKIIEIDENNELKLISTVKTEEETSWDDRYNGEKDDNVGINDFSKSRLKEFLNNLYNSDYFSDSDKEKIVKHDLCVGKRALDDASMDGLAECSVLEKDQYVGLLQVNEYARASLDANCTSASNPQCQNYNYIVGMFNAYYSIKTQNAVLNNTYEIYHYHMGNLKKTSSSVQFNVVPVIYLDKDVLYKSGDGTANNPYIVR